MNSSEKVFEFSHFFIGKQAISPEKIGERWIKIFQTEAISAPMQSDDRKVACEDVLQRLCHQRAFDGMKKPRESAFDNRRSGGIAQVPRQPVEASIDVTGTTGRLAQARIAASVVKVFAPFFDGDGRRVKERDVRQDR